MALDVNFLQTEIYCYEMNYTADFTQQKSENAITIA
jgi:hypothetical protein